MNRFKNEIKVGLTILVAILVAFIGFRILQDIPFFGRSFQLYSHFEHVEGVTPGTTIYMSGVRVGSVRQVQFTDTDSIRVDMSFSDIEGIPKNSIASIEATDLLGSRAVIIHRSDHPEFIEEGGFIEGRFDTGLQGRLEEYGDDIAPKVSDATDNMSSVFREIDILLKDGGRQDLEGTLSNLNRTTHNVDQLVDEKNEDLAHAIDQFNKILANLDTLSTGRDEQVDTLLTNLEETSREMKTISRELSGLSGGLNETVEKLNRGEGSLGMMLNDPSLYNNLDSLAVELNTAAKKLNEDPRHFLKHMRLIDIF